MLLNRREFLRGLGIALTSLSAPACSPSSSPRPTPSTAPLATSPPTATATPSDAIADAPPAAPKPTASAGGEATVTASASTSSLPALSLEAPAWRDLRALWVSLNGLARDGLDFEQRRELRERLLAQHRFVLGELVRAGELDLLVQDEMQVAYAETTLAFLGMSCHLTCDPFEPSIRYQTEGRTDLLHQVGAQAKMAEQGEADEGTVALAAESVARDIAYLMLTEQQRKSMGEYIKRQTEGAWPTFSNLELSVPAQCQQAARILCALLSKSELEGR